MGICIDQFWALFMQCETPIKNDGIIYSNEENAAMLFSIQCLLWIIYRNKRLVIFITIYMQISSNNICYSLKYAN